MEDLEGLAVFIFKRSYDATIERLAELPFGSYSNTMRVDGYDAPIDIAVRLDVSKDQIVADFEGTSPPSPKGINCPLIYSAAYAYAIKCALAPEIPNNHVSLKQFKIAAPTNCILNAQRPAPVSVRHVLGHLVPDAVLGAIHKMLPGRVPAEGSGALWNLHISARPLQGNNGPAEAASVPRYCCSTAAAWAHVRNWTARVQRRFRAVFSRCRSRQRNMSARSSSGGRNCATVPVVRVSTVAVWARSWKSRRRRGTRSTSTPCLTASRMLHAAARAAKTAPRAQLNSMTVRYSPRRDASMFPLVAG
ncbi:N-methylhydantoinase B (plasmid) [Sinorhizobium sp. CCBAU 05631]|nr:N-methylhydantoinase B [Sinorhizobium sp. CCBAU 05631]